LAAGAGLLSGVQALRRLLMAGPAGGRRLLAAGGHKGGGQSVISAWLGKGRGR